MGMIARYSHALKRAKKKNRVPKWVDRKVLYEVYKKCPNKKRVDHIIPLNHELVSGLHVPENLQYLTDHQNQEKANKFEPYVERRNQT